MAALLARLLFRHGPILTISAAKPGTVTKPAAHEPPVSGRRKSEKREVGDSHTSSASFSTSYRPVRTARHVCLTSRNTQAGSNRAPRHTVAQYKT
ncbi:hypothetical protein F4802DRAFT_566023 [Xylaria palmicola]|nr:hypothetical protein F4802DRAFT_566023 [Xylaria palmicola]